MKKVLVVFLLLGIVAGGLFADEPKVTVSGWGRVNFVPLAIEVPDEGDSRTLADMGVSWGDNPSIGATVSGSADKIGFSVGFGMDGESIGIGDPSIWIKPIPQLKATFNVFYEDNLRGKLGPGSDDIDGYTGAEAQGADWLFTRLGNGKWGTLLLSIYPIDNLFLYYQVTPGIGNGNGRFANVKAEDVYKTSKFAVGYKLEGIGLARAQFIGNPDSWGVEIDEETGLTIPGELTNDQRIEAAFNLTMVPNLNLDIGLKYWIPVSKEPVTGYKGGGTKGIGFGIAGKYTLDALGILARIDGQLAHSEWQEIAGSKTTKSYDPAIWFALNPEYKISDDLSVGGDFRLEVVPGYANDPGSKTEGGIKTGFDAYGKLGLGSGDLKIGLAVQIPTEEYKDAGKRDLIVSFPIQATYSF